jgi:hypothetical protein
MTMPIDGKALVDFSQAPIHGEEGRGAVEKNEDARVQTRIEDAGVLVARLVQVGVPQVPLATGPHEAVAMSSRQACCIASRER